MPGGDFENLFEAVSVGFLEVVNKTSRSGFLGDIKINDKTDEFVIGS